jgi:hypothetical protein
MLAGGTEDKEHAMSQKLNAAIAVIGIDIGKNSFHIVGQNQRGAIVLRQKWSRGQAEARLANLPAVLDRYGGLRRRASSQSQAPNAWPRCPPDAGEIGAPLFESVRSCWSGASPCGKACVACGPSCRVSSRRAPMCSRLACCASSRIWRETSAGWMGVSRGYLARSKRWPVKIRPASD